MSLVKRIPFFEFATTHRSRSQRARFRGSKSYWEHRYAKGGDSGVGSYGKFSEFKAEFINNFIKEHQLFSFIEFGCGDGNQLLLVNYRSYLGLDVSVTAIERCQQLFAGDPTKKFMLMDEYAGETAEVALSLDVIYHLVEDSVFEDYMRRLFDAAKEYVIIYSSDFCEIGSKNAQHVRHRKFSDWIEAHATDWRFIQRVKNKYPYQGDYTQGSFADFWVYQRT